VIISRTPFRVSFLGGGTDLPAFYQEEEGAVLSTTIDKYIYITVNDRFDSSYRLAYSKTEICERVDQIEHKIFRAVLSKYDKLAHERNGSRGLELLSMADIPSGTGLGSSSSFTVGLLHALKAHLGLFQSAEALASEASQIEIEDLKEPIGKQDQYAAAYGGLQYIRFLRTGEVSVEPVICSRQTKDALEKSIMVFYTGLTRSASDVLSEQKNNTHSKRETLREMKNLAFKLKGVLEDGKGIAKAGELLHEGWMLKKTLASGISATQIDDWYARARSAGASGGKILGAGGGGFLMVLCEPAKQERVRQELKELRCVPMGLESFGSKIIFVG
jgi:D-glycero-alpha-D-manno-heptose-7-phosphate kinase